MPDAEICAFSTPDEALSALDGEAMDIAFLDLEKALGEAGAGDVLIKEWGKLGVDRSRVFCDYYEYLTGNPSTVNSYKGMYMSQYDWAKNTLKKLDNT